MTLIKHSPNTTLKTNSEQSTTFLVKLSTPFVSAVKRIDKMFTRTRSDTVVVKGMGKAMEKTLGIGGTFDDKLGYSVGYYTGSVEVLDEVVDEEDEAHESVYKKRMVSYVELRIRKDRK
ncbi:uncharacterized protein CANTADRAFT_7249 [Suhomyces tanzawaensis NRRL Y-17324]|uniref:Uncharacterized protein n=1 Tax=Suhomyces tanzawaensis NRRL Y-17324 TaxID=984487 RepID=A0A1E4SED0_9ASCO|nr:uncharacterized protein CANTADRAFT_7249 [Suhomyces tanzawaensis NRRL Y-17324]ODV77752.1 hypothetical protein CANTADRAFT_7249 [Suhomyces tanzawaensis NRRL Y-17324]